MGRTRAFTLIELLVVVVIIGISIGALTLSLRTSDSSRMRHAIDVLEIQAEYLSQQSVLRATSYSITMDQRGTRFWVNSDGDWVPFAEERFVREQRWPIPGVSVLDQLDPKSEKVPSLYFFPDGTNSPADIMIYSSVGTYRVKSDLVGHVTVGPA